MKKQFLLLTLLLCFCVGNSQDIVFEGDTFKDALLNLYRPPVDINGDGEISYEEAEAVKVLQFNGSWVIDNIVGIKHFINLESLSLNEGDFSMVEIDLRNQSKLISLTLDSAYSLKKIYMSGVPVESLRLSYCTDLEFICTDVEYVDLVNEALLAGLANATDVIVTTDCDEEEVVYEFSDLLNIGATVTTTGIINLRVTDLGLEKGVELISTIAFNIITGDLDSVFHNGGTEAILDFSNLPTGTYFISVTTNMGVYNSNFVKL